MGALVHDRHHRLPDEEQGGVGEPAHQLVLDPNERFVNRQRVRAGFGYRRSFTWRFEALFMWGRSRNTISESFKPSNTGIDLRVKYFF